MQAGVCSPLRVMPDPSGCIAAYLALTRCNAHTAPAAHEPPLCALPPALALLRCMCVHLPPAPCCFILRAQLPLPLPHCPALPLLDRYLFVSPKAVAELPSQAPCMAPASQPPRQGRLTTPSGAPSICCTPSMAVAMAQPRVSGTWLPKPSFSALNPGRCYLYLRCYSCSTCLAFR